MSHTKQKKRLEDSRRIVNSGVICLPGNPPERLFDIEVQFKTVKLIKIMDSFEGVLFPQQIVEIARSISRYPCDRRVILELEKAADYLERDIYWEWSIEALREHAQARIDCVPRVNKREKGHRYGTQWPGIRIKTLKRDAWRCALCGLNINRKSKGATVHHIISWKVEGHDYSNLVSLCKSCHDVYHRARHQPVFRIEEKGTDLPIVHVDSCELVSPSMRKCNGNWPQPSLLCERCRPARVGRIAGKEGMRKARKDRFALIHDHLIREHLPSDALLEKALAIVPEICLYHMSETQNRDRIQPGSINVDENTIGFDRKARFSPRTIHGDQGRTQPMSEGQIVNYTCHGKSYKARIGMIEANGRHYRFKGTDISNNGGRRLKEGDVVLFDPYRSNGHYRARNVVLRSYVLDHLDDPALHNLVQLKDMDAS